MKARLTNHFFSRIRQRRLDKNIIVPLVLKQLLYLPNGKYMLYLAVKGKPIVVIVVKEGSKIHFLTAWKEKRR